jgi:hypothetical protein
LIAARKEDVRISQATRNTKTNSNAGDSREPRGSGCPSGPLVRDKHQTCASRHAGPARRMYLGTGLRFLCEAGVSVKARYLDCRGHPGVSPGSRTFIWTRRITDLPNSGLLVLVTCGILIFFHLRRTKRDAREDVEDRFQSSDYGLDEVPPGRKPRADDDETGSHDGSSNGSSRRHHDPLHPGVGQMNGHSNQFDDASSTGSSQAWPRREGSKPSPLGKEI